MRPEAERQSRWRALLRPGLLVFGCILSWCGLAGAQDTGVASQSRSSTSERHTDQQATGSVSGIVSDVGGGMVGGAQVTLTSEGSAEPRVVIADEGGRFSFADVPAGKFSIVVSADGLAPGAFSGELQPGQDDEVPGIELRVATAMTEVEVNLSQEEVAEGEIQAEEKQRLFGVVPNFYVSYTWNAAPLTTRQKFALSTRSLLDPVTVIMAAGDAGVQQSQNSFSGYGTGAKGYAKRFGASYADDVIGSYLGGAILPTLFHEDPRYFYKGTGSTVSRGLYAMSAAVMARSDSGKWRPSYAGVLGDMGAGAISNIYYPASNRHGASLTIENGFLSIGFDAVGNLLQEFFFHKLSSGVPKYAAKP